MRNGALTALEALTVCIKVPNRLVRVHIASEFCRLEAALHLLDKVLAIHWLVNLHEEVLNIARFTSEWALNSIAVREGFPVALFADDILTAAQINWLLERQIKVPVAYLTHHEWIHTSPIMIFLVTLDLLFHVEFFLEFLLDFLFELLLDFLLELLLEFFELVIEPDICNKLSLRCRVCTVHVMAWVLELL